RNEIVSNYPCSANGRGCVGGPVFGQGISLFAVNSNGPTSVVMHQNTVDANSWSLGTIANPIAWSPINGFVHNIYYGGMVNGNPLSLPTGAQITVDGNILSNEQGGSAFRVGGIYTNNLLAAGYRNLVVNQPGAYTTTITGNVVIDSLSTAGDGIEF